MRILLSITIDPKPTANFVKPEANKATVAPPIMAISNSKRYIPVSGYGAPGEPNVPQTTMTTSGSTIPSKSFTRMPLSNWNPQYPIATSAHNSSINLKPIYIW